jgi:hypothetical protein
MFIDDKKIIVISAKYKKNDPTLFVVKTDVFGQLNFIEFNTKYVIVSDDNKITAHLKGHSKDTRIETAVFIIEQS